MNRNGYNCLWSMLTISHIYENKGLTAFYAATLFQIIGELFFCYKSTEFILSEFAINLVPIPIRP